jgi:hypothetical protein
MCTNQIAIPLKNVTFSKLFAHFTTCFLKKVSTTSKPITPITDSLNSGGFSKKVTNGKYWFKTTKGATNDSVTNPK